MQVQITPRTEQVTTGRLSDGSDRATVSRTYYETQVIDNEGREHLLRFPKEPTVQDILDVLSLPSQRLLTPALAFYNDIITEFGVDMVEDWLNASPVASKAMDAENWAMLRAAVNAGPGRNVLTTAQRDRIIELMDQYGFS